MRRHSVVLFLTNIVTMHKSLVITLVFSALLALASAQALTGTVVDADHLALDGADGTGKATFCD